MFYTYAVRFEVTGNLEYFVIFSGKASVAMAILTLNCGHGLDSLANSLVSGHLCSREVFSALTLTGLTRRWSSRQL